MGEDPFEKILKYIEEQRKMPHVATNIALKELTWPPASKKAAAPPKDISSTFPKTEEDSSAKEESAEETPQEPTEGQKAEENETPADGEEKSE